MKNFNFTRCCLLICATSSMLLTNSVYAKDAENKTTSTETIQEETSNEINDRANDKISEANTSSWRDSHKKRVKQMFEEVSRLQNDSFSRNWDFFSDFFTGSDTINTNMATYDNQYLLNIDYPGFDKKELIIEVDGDYLIINGKKNIEHASDKEKSFANQEYRNSFQHKLWIPIDVDKSLIISSFKNGVLTLTLPRVLAKKRDAKQVPIS